MDRQDSSQQASRAKPWWVFTILSVIALVCVSCSNAPQQTSSSARGTVRSPHVTEGARLPLTDSVPPQATPTPTAPTIYEAEAPQNTLSGGARLVNCSKCPNGYRVGYIGLNAGEAGTLQFNNVSKSVAGKYMLTIDYILAGQDHLTMDIRVNGGPARVLNVPATPNVDTVGTASITVNLNAGNNTIEFSNSSDPAPDMDWIVV